jgi:hypothetical protein
MGPGRLRDDAWAGRVIGTASRRQRGRRDQRELGGVRVGRRRGDVHERVRVLGPARGDLHRDVSASNVTEATPSALTGGNAFTVTWDGNGG